MFSLLLLSGYLFILITRTMLQCSNHHLLSLDHRGDTAWRCFDLESSTFHRESGESKSSAEVVSHVLDSAVGAGSNKHLPGSDGCLLVTGYHTGFKTQGKQDHVSPSVTRCHQVSPLVHFNVAFQSLSILVV